MVHPTGANLPRVSEHGPGTAEKDRVLLEGLRLVAKARVRVALRHENRATMEAEWASKNLEAAAIARGGPREEGNDEDVNLAARSLRLALAMRGGVSLAVWIGGAVAELDLVRALRVYRGRTGVAVALAWDDTTGPTPSTVLRAYQYGRMLAARGVHRVELDVFAGASAGGLNSVLAAVAGRAGRSVTSALETWQETGGLYQLLRSEGLSGIPSLLRGDDYFYPAVYDTLEKFYIAPDSADGQGYGPGRPLPHPGLKTDSVRVDLSATVLDAKEQENDRIREGQAGFRFATGLPGADIPDRPDEIDLSRLALAARTTSSFPGAFERSPINSYERKSARDILPNYAPPLPKEVDLSRAFLAHRPADAPPFEVIDGGVFDNIPIERAFRAIGMQRASHPVDRTLVYLDPDPPVSPDPPIRKRSKPRENLFSVTLKAAFAKSKENAREDQEEMESFILDKWVRQGRYDPLAVHDLSGFDWEEARRAYARSRAPVDSALLQQALADPESFQLEEGEPFPTVWRLAPGYDREEVVREWIHRMELENFVNSITEDTPGDLVKVVEGPIALRETALWLLECVQWMELVRQITDPGYYSQAKNAALRMTIYTVLEHTNVMVRQRVLAVGRKMWEDPEAGQVHARSTIWWTAPYDTQWLWLEIEKAMGLVVAILRHWSRNVESNRHSTHEEARTLRLWWDEAPWQHFLAMRQAHAGQHRTAKYVAPLFAVIGSPGTREAPRFFEITGAWQWPQLDDGPLSEAIDEARVTHHEQNLGRILKSKHSRARASTYGESLGEEHPGILPASTRLAGTQLFNFGGFMSEDWRMTDWWWGRVDAAARLTHYLRPHPGSDRDLTPEKLASSVVDQYREERLAEPQAERRVPAEQMLTARVGGMAGLRGAYKVSLLQRGLRGVTRAVYNLTGKAKAIGMLLLHIVFAPLLPFLPSIVQPPRFIAALGVTFLGVYAARTPDPGWEWTVGAVLVIVGAVLVIVWGGWAAWSIPNRWESIKGLDLPTGRGRQVEGMRATTLGLVAVLLLVAAVLLVTAGVVLSQHGDGLVAAGYTLAAAGAVGSAVTVGRSLPTRNDREFRGRSRIAWFLAGAVIMGLLALPWLKGVLQIPGVDWVRGLSQHPETVVAGALILAGTILGWGVVGPPRTPPGPNQDATPVEPSSGNEALSALSAILLAVLAVAAGVGAALLVHGIGAHFGKADAPLLGVGAWWTGVLVWANVMWLVPMRWRLESPAWSDDCVHRACMAQSQ